MPWIEYQSVERWQTKPSSPKAADNIRSMLQLYSTHNLISVTGSIAWACSLKTLQLELIKK